MKPVCLLFSHLNLQVLWFSLDFGHYSIALNSVFLHHHFNSKQNKNNQIQVIWVGKCNYYLPFGVVFLPFSISLRAVCNLADVCFEGWKPIANNNTSGYDSNRTKVEQVKWMILWNLLNLLISHVRNDREFFPSSFGFIIVRFQNVNSFENRIVAMKNLRINVCEIYGFHRHLLGVRAMSIQVSVFAQSIDNGFSQVSCYCNIVKISMKKTALRCVNNMEKSFGGKVYTFHLFY